MGVLNPDGTDTWVETRKPWWNILLYTNGVKPFKYVVKKIDGVWMVRFGTDHESVINDTKRWMKKAGYRVRSYPVKTPCRCKKNSRGKCPNGPNYHKHRTLWADRMKVGRQKSWHPIRRMKMVSDLIEKGEWV